MISAQRTRIKKRLRRKRFKLGLTQQAVAKKAKVSLANYNGYENLKITSLPNIITAKRVSRALDMTIDEMVR